MTVTSAKNDGWTWSLLHTHDGYGSKLNIELLSPPDFNFKYQVIEVQEGGGGQIDAECCVELVF